MLQEVTNQIGVLGVVRDLGDTKTLLFPLHIDVEKEELVRGYTSSLRLLTPNMLEMVSGGMESEDDSDLLALEREFREERQLPHVKLERVANTLRVFQVRDGKEVEFDVMIFRAFLSEMQVSSVKEKAKLVEYEDGFLSSNLGMMGEKPFRPLAFAAMQVMIKNNFWKQL